MELEEKLDKIFKTLFKIEIENNLRDTSLFEEPFHISARNFLVLFLEIEKQYEIRFSDLSIENMKLVTYNGIVKEIKKIQEDSRNVD